MRVDFGDRIKQREFFRGSKSKLENSTWKQVYLKLTKNSKRKFSYWEFEKWFKGVYKPPLDVVEKMREISKSELKELNVKILPDNYGQIQGGKKKYRLFGSSLTIDDRIRGGINSIKNKSSLMRKSIGPKGERMFNPLEKTVAEILLKMGLNYEYEKVLRINSEFIIPDFVLNDTLIIECTAFRDFRFKAIRLRKKFNLIKSVNKELLIITTDRLKKNYQIALKNLDVVTPEEFPAWLITSS